MDKKLIRFSHSRRRFVAASTATASLALATPITALAGLPLPPTEMHAGLPLQAWWGTLVADAAGEPELRPGWWINEQVSSDQDLRIRMHAPKGLNGSNQIANLSIDLLYRTLADQPFSLWRGGAADQPVDQEIHAMARALKSLRLRSDNRMLDLPLTPWHRPVLLPGHYLLVVDLAGNGAPPDWSRLCWEPGVGRITGPGCAPDLISLMMDVSCV